MICRSICGHYRKREVEPTSFTVNHQLCPHPSMTTYSAFFSSGLLAPHHAYFTSSSPRTPTKQRAESYLSPMPTPSPARPSSPMPIPDDSDVELAFDMDVDQKEKDRDNDATPTQSQRGTLTSSSHILPKQQHQQPQPRLRKRRSSITLAASPMNAIRSPARTAGAALQLQRHLPPPPPGGLGARSRSGSLAQAGELGLDVVAGNDMRNVARESTSLLGRMRSGSVGGLLRYLSFST